MKKKIYVAGAIITNNRNEILCALRSNTMSLPNVWEFPGGKIEGDETVQETVEREIKEELDCTVKACETAYQIVEYEYETFKINLTTINCKIIEGEPKATEHAKLIWLNKENLLSLNWAKANLPIIRKLIDDN